jgi:fucose 4-O-acetylase-like acetyltransferase
MPGQQGWNERSLVYFFHMPLFFFLSGYFISGRIKVFKSFLMRAKPLIVCFLVASAVYFLLFNRRFEFESLVFIFLAPFNHLWFIPVLLMIMATDAIVSRYMPNKRFMFFVGSVLLSLIAVRAREYAEIEFVADYLYKTVFRFAENSVYFFLGGLLAANIGNFKTKSSVVIGVLALTTGLFSVYFVNNYQDIVGSDYLAYAIAYVMFNIALAVFISILSLSGMQYLALSWLNKASENTLFVYLWHYLFILVLFKVLGASFVTGYALLFSLFITVVLYLFAISVYPKLGVPRKVDMLLGIRRV